MHRAHTQNPQWNGFMLYRSLVTTKNNNENNKSDNRNNKNSNRNNNNNNNNNAHTHTQKDNRCEQRSKTTGHPGGLQLRLARFVDRKFFDREPDPEPGEARSALKSGGRVHAGWWGGGGGGGGAA